MSVDWNSAVKLFGGGSVVALITLVLNRWFTVRDRRHGLTAKVTEIEKALQRRVQILEARVGGLENSESESAAVRAEFHGARIRALLAARAHVEDLTAYVRLSQFPSPHAGDVWEASARSRANVAVKDYSSSPARSEELLNALRQLDRATNAFRVDDEVSVMGVYDAAARALVVADDAETALIGMLARGAPSREGSLGGTPTGPREQ